MTLTIAIRALLLLGTWGLLASWLNWNRFTPALIQVPGLDDEPRQQAVELAPFTRTVEDVDYRIQPLYEYSLTGLVVSFKRFQPGIGIHERWGDYINVADVCVVWGENADLDLNAFEFWNLEFTCNWRTRDAKAWRAFDKAGVANNHLITANPDLEDRLETLEVGDQIRLEGWLAEYGPVGGPVRGTSTTRTDTGNGACETVYLTDFEIIRPMASTWRRLWWPSWVLIFAGLGLWWIAPHRHA